MSLASISESICPTCKFLTKPNCQTERLSLSPVPHLLDSCRTLSSEESVSVEGFVVALDKQIADLSAQLEYIDNVRRALSHNRAVHRNRLLPINRIPDELLIDIFHLYLPKPPIVRAQPAMILSHVCRRWRNVVTSDARIWRVMDVSTMSRPLIDLWISRSQELPLTILESSSRPPHSAILEQSHRLRMITAYSETLKDMSESKHQFPMLRVLYCHVIGNELAQFTRLPFSQITHLSAWATNLKWVLVHLPNLISLEIEQKLGVNPSTSRPLAHRHLKHFKLHKPAETLRSTAAFQKFDFPALKSLCILNIGHTLPIPSSAIQDIVASSMALETLLIIDGFPDDVPKLVQVLEKLADLRRLYIKDEWGSTTSFLHLVEVLSTRPSFLPNLRELVLGPPSVTETLVGQRQSLVVGQWEPDDWKRLLGCPGDGAWDV